MQLILVIYQLQEQIWWWSSKSWICFGGYYSINIKVNIIEFVDNCNTGNAQDFGDLNYVKLEDSWTALSDSHGGLGGY